MSLRVVIIGLMMVTALALGLIGFQIANPTQPTTTAVVLGVKPDVVIPDLGKRMLEAINTGHDGSMCTVHANTARDALTRVENMVQMGQYSLPARAIRQQIVGAVDLIVHLERQHDGGRRVTQIADVCNLEGDVITMSEIAMFEFDPEDERGRIVGHYRASQARPSFMQRLEYFGLGRAWVAANGEV